MDLLHVLFGTVLGLDDDALLLVTGTASVTLLAVAATYRLLVAECLDPGFLRASGGAGRLGAHGLPGAGGGETWWRASRCWAR